MFQVQEIAGQLPSWYRVLEDEDLVVVRCICGRFQARYLAHVVRIEEVLHDTLRHDRWSHPSKYKASHGARS